MPVLVVSPNAAVAANTVTILEAVAGRHGVKLCSVVKGDEDPREWRCVTAIIVNMTGKCVVRSRNTNTRVSDCRQCL